MFFIQVKSRNSLGEITLAIQFFNLETLFMKSITQSLKEELLQKLGEWENRFDPCNLEDQRLELIARVLERTKQNLLSHQFSSDDEEVNFFKSVLPELFSLYIYYADKIEWDRIRTQGSPECRYHFTDRIFSQAEELRKQEKDFYEYCRDGKTHLDKIYFLRESPLNQENVYPLRFIIDRHSPTRYCEIKGRLLAFSRLELEMHHLISEKRESDGSEKSNGSALKWTDKTIYLVELGYALKEQGSFNNGQASLTDIFGFFEKTFGVDLLNTPRQFQDILRRKNGNTTYLNLLAGKLEKRIENLENENLN